MNNTFSFFVLIWIITIFFGVLFYWIAGRLGPTLGMTQDSVFLVMAVIFIIRTKIETSRILTLFIDVVAAVKKEIVNEK